MLNLFLYVNLVSHKAIISVTLHKVGSSSREVIILPSFFTIGTLVIDIMVFVCHVTLQNHVIFVLLYDEEPVKVYHHASTFGGHRHCGSEDIMVLVCHVILQDYVTRGDVTV